VNRTQYYAEVHVDRKKSLVHVSVAGLPEDAARVAIEKADDQAWELIVAQLSRRGFRTPIATCVTFCGREIWVDSKADLIGRQAIVVAESLTRPATFEITASDFSGKQGVAHVRIDG
jgi:hypothetical protein